MFPQTEATLQGRWMFNGKGMIARPTTALAFADSHSDVRSGNMFAGKYGSTPWTDIRHSGFGIRRHLAVGASLCGPYVHGQLLLGWKCRTACAASGQRARATERAPSPCTATSATRGSSCEPGGGIATDW